MKKLFTLPLLISTISSLVFFTPMQAQQYTDADFKKTVLQAQLPVLVDFFAEWCGFCKRVDPMVTEIAKKYSGKLKLIKINVDDNEGISSNYNIQALPTLLIFKNGKMVASHEGVFNESQQLQDFIDTNI